MTIIQPNKNRIKVNLTPLILAAAVILAILFAVFLNNQIVNLKYSLSDAEKRLERLRVANAESKNQLYVILDMQNHSELASRLGLVKENKPIYLKEQWQEFASRY